MGIAKRNRVTAEGVRVGHTIYVVTENGFTPPSMSAIRVCGAHQERHKAIPRWRAVISVAYWESDPHVSLFSSRMHAIRELDAARQRYERWDAASDDREFDELDFGLIESDKDREFLLRHACKKAIKNKRWMPYLPLVRAVVAGAHRE